MVDLNKVFLAGRLTRTPEIRYTVNSTAVLNFSLAISNKYFDREGNLKDDVLFVDVVVWGKQAESCSKYLQKGSPVLVEGRLQLESWENKSGEKRRKISVVAQRVQFLPKGNGSSGDFSDKFGDSEKVGFEDTLDNISGDDIPVDGGLEESGISNQENVDDDLPF